MTAQFSPSIDDAVPAAPEFPRQFLLWAMRKWVAGFTGTPGAHALLRHSLPKAAKGQSATRSDAMDEGFAALDHLMRVIAAGASRHIEIHKPCCSATSQDEQAILDAVALVQSEDKVEAGFVLSRFLTPTGIRSVEAPMRHLARIFTRSGLTVRTERSSQPPVRPRFPQGLISTAVH